MEAAQYQGTGGYDSPAALPSQDISDPQKSEGVQLALCRLNTTGI